MQKDDWYKVREIAYSALIGSHIDPKKLPKSKDKFMELDKKDNTLNSNQLLQIMKAAKAYKDAKNNK